MQISAVRRITTLRVTRGDKTQLPPGKWIDRGDRVGPRPILFQEGFPNTGVWVGELSCLIYWRKPAGSNLSEFYGRTLAQKNNRSEPNRHRRGRKTIKFCDAVKNTGSAANCPVEMPA